MKKFNILLLVVLFVGTVSAQVTNQFMYQAVVRDQSGRLICNQEVGVRLNILQGSPSGLCVHSETYSVKTNANGLYSVVVGSTVAIDNVDWSQGQFFVQGRVDVNGGSNYTVETIEELRSTPLAQRVAVAGDVVGDVVRVEQDPIYMAWGKNYNDMINRPVNISTWVNDVGYITDYTETQVLSISNDTVYLTGGSFVKLPAGFDGDWNSLTNKPVNVSAWNNDAGYLTGYTEVQVLSLRQDTIFLTGGSYVVLPLASESQNLANVSGFGHSADSNQLKGLMDPTDPQDVITRQYLDTLILQYTHIDRGTHNVSVADECEKVFWNGTYYTSSGTYTYAYANSEGFYSVDTLYATIRHGDHHTYFQTVPSSYTWHNTTYTYSGTFLYGYTATNGCPSVDTLRLTVQSDHSDQCVHYRYEYDTAMIEVCGSYDWNGQHLTSSGVYQYQIPTRYGQICDSIVRVNAIIYPVFRIDTAVRDDNPVTWRGHTYSHQGDYRDTLTDQNGCDSVFVLHLMQHGNPSIGIIPGTFSVSPGLQVNFSQGNLLYQSANNRWIFADRQYDQFNDYCIGPYYRPYTDLFSWATSGYHDAADSRNLHYHPWDYYPNSAAPGTPAYDENRYGYGPSTTMPYVDLEDSSANYDWGVYNPIVNGGNGAGMWKTLSKYEWDYLLNLRPNASSLRGKGRIAVNQVSSWSYTYQEGYIILSDGWTAPSGLTFSPDATYASTNSYTQAQWARMEAAGALFLPVGFYWSNSCVDGGNAYALNTNFTIPQVASYNRSNRYQVRLAQYVTGGTTPCRCTHFDTVIVSNGPYTWHGHTITQSGDYMDTLINAAGCDSLIFYSLIIRESGIINSLFSVGSGRQVYFSKGNLQYNVEYDIWRFSPHQYDYFGTYNRYISDTNKCWIDLFGFGTSGYHDSTDNLNVYYYPYSYSSGSYYGPSPNMSEQSLVNDSREYDWGVHNPIANGGNVPDQWRTLTTNEWYYLLCSRPSASSLRRGCTVNGVAGLLLLPDNWVQPSGFVFNSGNIYEGPDWVLLENSGAVFLPAAGRRTDKNIYYPGEYYYYWSSSARPYTTYAQYFYGSQGGITVYSSPTAVSYNSRSVGCSVRLVKDY